VHGSEPYCVICAIGDLNLDVVVLPRAPLVRDGDTPATIRLCAGGQAANVASWVSALGGRGRLVCARGTDAAAQIAGAELERRGVEVCGPVIDGAGGSTVYALNDLYATAKAENVVPLGLLTGAKLLREVPTDAAITYDMVEILTDSTLYHLRAMQDSGAAGAFGLTAQQEPPQVTRLAS